MSEDDETEAQIEMMIGSDPEKGWVVLSFEKAVGSVCFRPANAIKVAELIVAAAKRLQN